MDTVVNDLYTWNINKFVDIESKMLDAKDRNPRPHSTISRLTQLLMIRCHLEKYFSFGYYSLTILKSTNFIMAVASLLLSAQLDTAS